MEWGWICILNLLYVWKFRRSSIQAYNMSRQPWHERKIEPTRYKYICSWSSGHARKTHIRWGLFLTSLVMKKKLAIRPNHEAPWDLCSFGIFYNIGCNSVGTFWDNLSAPYSRVTWLMKMGLKGCPETSVQNCHSTLWNIPQERRSHVEMPEITHMKLLVTWVFLFSFYALSIYNIHWHSNAVYVTFYIQVFFSVHFAWYKLGIKAQKRHYPLSL
jgi:hypothetical protein